MSNIFREARTTIYQQQGHTPLEKDFWKSQNLWMNLFTTMFPFCSPILTSATSQERSWLLRAFLSESNHCKDRFRYSASSGRCQIIKRDNEQLKGDLRSSRWEALSLGRNNPFVSMATFDDCFGTMTKVFTVEMSIWFIYLWQWRCINKLMICWYIDDMLMY